MTETPTTPPAETAALVADPGLDMQRAGDLALQALRLHLVHEQMPADRGGAQGPRGLAWAAFIAARDAALAVALAADRARDRGRR